MTNVALVNHTKGFTYLDFRKKVLRYKYPTIEEVVGLWKSAPEEVLRDLETEPQNKLNLYRIGYLLYEDDGLIVMSANLSKDGRVREPLGLYKKFIKNIENLRVGDEMHDLIPNNPYMFEWADTTMNYKVYTIEEAKEKCVLSYLQRPNFFLTKTDEALLASPTYNETTKQYKEIMATPLQNILKISALTK
jgi:hypothetical protein